MARIRERRRGDAFAFVERRKGAMRMYLQLTACAALVGELIWLLR
jgi:hypothetical protein